MFEHQSLQPAFVLHSRPYRDTSALVELFTRECGRVTVIAKGARSNKNKNAALWQPFTPVLVSWYGKTELKSASAIEPASAPFFLEGARLLSGMYLNELLHRLLSPLEPQPMMYEVYKVVLAELTSADVDIEIVLRSFERRLIDELGYGVSFTDAINKANLNPEKVYRFQAPYGFVLVDDGARLDNRTFFSGEVLLEIEKENYEASATKKSAKHLMRQILANYLGPEPLNSRRLFASKRI